MTKITVRRRPRWKRVLRAPLTWYRHYAICRRVGKRGASVKTAVSTWHSTAVKPETLVKMENGRCNLIVSRRHGFQAFAVMYLEDSGLVINHQDGPGYTPLADFDYWCLPPRGIVGDQP